MTAPGKEPIRLIRFNPKDLVQPSNIGARLYFFGAASRTKGYTHALDVTDQTDRSSGAKSCVATTSGSI